MLAPTLISGNFQDLFTVIDCALSYTHKLGALLLESEV